MRHLAILPAVNGDPQIDELALGETLLDRARTAAGHDAHHEVSGVTPMSRYDWNRAIADALMQFAQKVERRTLAQLRKDNATPAGSGMVTADPSPNAMELYDRAIASEDLNIRATALEVSDSIIDVIEQMLAAGTAS